MGVVGERGGSLADVAGGGERLQALAEMADEEEPLPERVGAIAQEMDDERAALGEPGDCVGVRRDFGGFERQVFVEQDETGGLGAGELEGFFKGALDGADVAREDGAGLREVFGAELLLQAAPAIDGEEGAVERFLEQNLAVAALGTRLRPERDAGVDDGAEQAFDRDKLIALVGGAIDGDTPGAAAGVFAVGADAVKGAGVCRTLDEDCVPA